MSEEQAPQEAGPETKGKRGWPDFVFVAVMFLIGPGMLLISAPLFWLEWGEHQRREHIAQEWTRYDGVVISSYYPSRGSNSGVPSSSFVQWTDADGEVHGLTTSYLGDEGGAVSVWVDPEHSDVVYVEGTSTPYWPWGAGLSTLGLLFIGLMVFSSFPARRERAKKAEEAASGDGPPA